MFFEGKLYSQVSFDFMGGMTNMQNSRFRLNSLESNVSNYTGVRDWEFSLTYGGEFAPQYFGNIYSISFSKKLNEHYFYFRYTPGYQKDFTSSSFFRHDSVPTLLKSKYHYEEKFGFGYSFSLMSNLSAGFSFRYFTQEFSKDQVVTYFDSVTSIRTSNVTKDFNFWVGDIGVNYLYGSLNLSVSTINLATSKTISTPEYEPFLFKTETAVKAGIDYQVTKILNTKFSYETNNSLILGANLGFILPGGSLNFSVEGFHDKYQSPYFAGIIPGINFSGSFFSVSILGVKYFSSRSAKMTEDEFKQDGLHDIINNKYSSDKALLSINFALNTIRDKRVQFLGVNIEKNIFPSLNENYLDYPFAKGKVVNLTGKTLIVKPSSMIDDINKEAVFSPEVKIAPEDTAVIPFFTIINEGERIKKGFISQATFYLNTDGDKPDDEISKPVFINDENSWDGIVENLRHFVRMDFDRTFDYAKKTISSYKHVLDTLPQELENFYIAKVLFNNMAKKIVYVSDPRASSDKVQFPLETLDLKGGDCDDLSVAYCALLESVGVPTAFIDFHSDSSMSHVAVLVNTCLSPEEVSLITMNDKKFFLRKNDHGKEEVWIPVETTLLKDFDSAWETGSGKFYDEAIDKLGLAKGFVRIVDVY